MNVKELSREQLIEVKQRYLTEKLDEKGEDISCGELEAIDELVTDEEIFEEYADVEFDEDDFWSNSVCISDSCKIWFGPTYHSWDVFIDDEFLYSFGDFSEHFEGNETMDTLSYFVDDLIYIMVEEINEKRQEEAGEEGYCAFELDVQERNSLKEQMVEKLGFHYLGIDMTNGSENKSVDAQHLDVEELISNATVVSEAVNGSKEINKNVEIEK